MHLSTEGAARQDFALDPAVELRVVVADENDEPVAGADVQADGIKKGFIVDLARTDADGIAVVPGISRLKLPILFVKKNSPTSCRYATAGSEAAGSAGGPPAGKRPRSE